MKRYRENKIRVSCKNSISLWGGGKGIKFNNFPFILNLFPRDLIIQLKLYISNFYIFQTDYVNKIFQIEISKIYDIRLQIRNGKS